MTTNETKANELETAPAAGKGVDALAEAVRGLRFDVYALTTPEIRAAFDGKKSIAVVDPGTVAALKAALTRQPVAGDGWIRVIERAAETLDDLGAPLNAAELRALVSIESKPDKAAALSELRELMDITDPVERNDALVTFFRANGDMGRHGDAMCWTPEQTARHYLAPAATPTDGGEG